MASTVGWTLAGTAALALIAVSAAGGFGEDGVQIQIEGAWGSGVKGDGEIVSRSFELEPFDAVQASSGLKVTVIQGAHGPVTIETDSNLLEEIRPYVREGELRFETPKGGFKSKHGVFVTATSEQLSRGAASSASSLNLEGFSGASFKGESTSGADFAALSMSFDQVSLSSTSASDLSYEGKSISVSADASSGADIDLVGETGELVGQASSGADIDARKLTAANARLRASSGADIAACVSGRVQAGASSGGDVDVYCQPTEKDVTQSSGGDVSIH